MGYFHSLSAFFYMGGYADYVWPAYGIVFAVLMMLWIRAESRLKRLLRKHKNHYAD